MLPIHFCGPDVVTLALLSICWACPHRPADIDIPPRPSEFLTARIGLLLGSHVDIDVVHDWMIFCATMCLSVETWWYRALALHVFMVFFGRWLGFSYPCSFWFCLMWDCHHSPLFGVSGVLASLWCLFGAFWPYCWGVRCRVFSAPLSVLCLLRGSSR